MQNNDQIINAILSPEANQRYTRIKTYHKEKAQKIEQLLLNLYYSRRIANIISDEDFVKIISSIEDENKNVEIRIDRKRRDLDLDDF